MGKGIKQTAKRIVLGILVVVFLYIAFFSIQGFWDGLHTLDLCYNFMNLGYEFDYGTDAVTRSLTNGYLEGLNKIKTNFIWMCLDNLLLVVICLIWRGEK